jgi:fucose 4-O-acetylase-like acetyltransferase
MELSQFTSLKFKFWGFISMVLLVFVHGYNLNLRYLQPWTIPGESLSFTTFTQYFLANGIFRFRIPMLFIISGFLYAMHDQKPYKQRIHKRLRTLLIPYLLWSAIGLAFTFGLEMFTFGRNMVANSNIVQIDNTRLLLHDYQWYELLSRWILNPVPYQLWFIRVLLIYNLAYPALRWCVTRTPARWIFFSFAALLWIGTIGFGLVEGEGLLFFSLGIWMQKTNFNIEKPNRWLNPIGWGLAFIILTSIKTVMAFIGEPLLGNAVYPTLIIIHKLVVLSGLIACWFGGDLLVKWFMDKAWFVWLSAFSFIIYALHTPLVAYSIDTVLAWIYPLANYRIITFIILPVSVITFCICVGAFLRLIVPRFYGLLTGGRGI